MKDKFVSDNTFRGVNYTQQLQLFGDGDDIITSYWRKKLQY